MVLGLNQKGGFGCTLISSNVVGIICPPPPSNPVAAFAWLGTPFFDLSSLVNVQYSRVRKLCSVMKLIYYCVRPRILILTLKSKNKKNH